MNPEAQRIAIAEAREWTLCQPRPSIFSTPWISGMNPSPDKIDEIIPCDGSPSRKPNEADYGFETLPDYLHDLNAMHEAWKHCIEPKGLYTQILFANELLVICCPNADRLSREPYGDREYAITINATAAQRAEAFLRTLGLWSE